MQIAGAMGQSVGEITPTFIIHLSGMVSPECFGN